MGGCRCTFRDCRSKTDGNTHLFHFPVFDKLRCQQWIINARRFEFLNLTMSQLKNRVICQFHFQDDAFMNNKKNKLKFDAIPTENGPLCSTEEKAKTFVQEVSDLPLTVDDIENVETISATDKKDLMPVKFVDFLTDGVQTDINDYTLRNQEYIIDIDIKHPFEEKLDTSTEMYKECVKISEDLKNDNLQENIVGTTTSSKDIKPTEKINRTPKINRKIEIISHKVISEPIKMPLSGDIIDIITPKSIEKNRLSDKREKKHKKIEESVDISNISESKSNHKVIYDINIANVFNSIDTNICTSINPNVSNNTDTDISNNINTNTCNDMNTNICNSINPNVCNDIDTNICNSINNSNVCNDIDTNICKNMNPNVCNDINTNICSNINTNTTNNNNIVESVKKSEQVDEINFTIKTEHKPLKQYIINKKMTPKSSQRENHLTPERIAAIQEKRNFNMKLRDIIEAGLNKINVMDNTNINVKEENILITKKTKKNKDDNSITALKKQMQIMESNLINKIEQNSNQIFAMNNLLNITNNKSVLKKKKSTQTSCSTEEHKIYLFNEMSCFISESLKNQLYEELFINNVESTSGRPKRRKYR